MPLLQPINVQAAVTMINAINTTISQPNLVKKRSYPPNSNHEPTLKFFSTKKRRTTKSTMSKPTQEELNDCKEKVESEEPVFVQFALKRMIDLMRVLLNGFNVQYVL